MELDDEADDTGSYMTPVQREAAAIRRWRMRRLSCRPPRQRTGFSTTSTSFSNHYQPSPG